MSAKSLFVVDLNYLAPLPEVDVYLEGHRAFLRDGYAKNMFLASGPKVPRTGGIILAEANSLADLEAFLNLDPFKANGVADYSITEFNAVMHKEGLFSDGAQ